LFIFRKNPRILPAASTKKVSTQTAISIFHSIETFFFKQRSADTAVQNCNNNTPHRKNDLKEIKIIISNY